jgi:transketolase
VRAAFVRALIELASEDQRILLLTGDLGFMALEPFIEKFPSRFFNVGVAEQNMVGLATGLADAGFIPYVYSIATFASMRALEFVRNGPLLHRLPVRIVGVGGGFEYGPAGPTHHGLEDVALMRALPGMTIVAPADHAQTPTVVRATWSVPGPVYLRLGKDDRTTVPGLGPRFELGRAQWVRHGRDLAILALGNSSAEAVATSETLAATGIDCAVLVVASVNPPPLEDLVEALSRFRAVLTVEAHSVVGGLGSLVSEIVAERGLHCRVVRCGVRFLSDGRGGSERYLLGVHGLTREQLAETARRTLAEMAA